MAKHSVDDVHGNDPITNTILQLLGHKHMRYTPLDLEKAVNGKQNTFAKKAIRTVIKAMIANGDLVYTYHFNTTHLELNFRKPVRVSTRIVLSPHLCATPDCIKDGVFLKLDQGSAFGVGDHPTTRLCLRAVDRVMGQILFPGHHMGIKALDIGTGTGVLAMAAVGLGAQSALAIDNDAAALHEAHKNIQLNHLSHKIMLSQAPLESIENTKFDLIMANIRPPTLITCLPYVLELSNPDSYWVFSGCREQELNRVIEMLPADQTNVDWVDYACGWAVLVVHFMNRPYEVKTGGI